VTEVLKGLPKNQKRRRGETSPSPKKSYTIKSSNVTPGNPGKERIAKKKGMVGEKDSLQLKAKTSKKTPAPL